MLFGMLVVRLIRKTDTLFSVQLTTLLFDLFFPPSATEEDGVIELGSATQIVYVPMFSTFPHADAERTFDLVERIKHAIVPEQIKEGKRFVKDEKRPESIKAESSKFESIKDSKRIESRRRSISA
jgi:hypothetical protein